MDSELSVEQVREAFGSLEEYHPVRRGLVQMLKDAEEEAAVAVADVRLREDRDYYAGWLAAMRSWRAQVEEFWGEKDRGQVSGEPGPEVVGMRRPGGAR